MLHFFWGARIGQFGAIKHEVCGSIFFFWSALHNLHFTICIITPDASVFHKNLCILVSTQNFGRKNEGKLSVSGCGGGRRSLWRHPFAMLISGISAR